jgi:hypothetical protein
MPKYRANTCCELPAGMYGLRYVPVAVEKPPRMVTDCGTGVFPELVLATTKKAPCELFT